MPARLLPIPLAIIFGAIYVLGGFDLNGADLVGWNETLFGVQDAATAAMSDDTVWDVHDFLVDHLRTFDVPFDRPSY